MPHPVTPEDLAAIPAEHRRTIARWLAEKAEAVRPSFVMPPTVAMTVTAYLSGAAVDLVEPLAEDTTISHAAAILRDLAERTPR